MPSATGALRALLLDSRVREGQRRAVDDVKAAITPPGDPARRELTRVWAQSLARQDPWADSLRRRLDL